MTDKKEITWSAPEFEYHHKNSGWYLGVVIIAVAVTALAVLQGNFLFAVFTAVAAVLVVKWGAREPRYLDYTLTDSALAISGEKQYLYEQLAGFATRRMDALEDGLSELILRRKQRLGSYIKALFPTRHTEEIKHFLNRYLPEIEYEDSMADHLSRFLRF